MPLIDSPPDATARVYARSLFDMANKHGGQAEIESTVAELEDILELARQDQKFSEFLSSPAIASTDRERALEKIFKGRVSDLTYKFLQVLNEKGRIGQLPSIAAAFDQESQEKFGRVEVDVYTVEPVGADLLRTMKDRLGQVMGKEVVLHPYTDANMIGGVKFQIGDQLIDASLATHLRKLKDQLDTEGGANIRAKISRIVEEGGR
ncbi:MAG TPA: ATP synthase F1 subunit delta [Phycisphaerales bacterium]|nr:ATP synthase F1 subunit delta [Phycisphaerales bacterium]